MLSLNTLYDLDVLTTPHKQKKSLWDKLNHCRTDGGKEELKKILMLQEHSLEHAQQRQQAIAYIVSKAKQPHFPVTESELFYLQHYLSSNYSIDSANTQVGLAIRSYAKLIGSKGDYLYILSAVKQAFLVVNRIKDVYEYLYSSSAPKLLKVIFAEMERCLGNLQNADVKIILDSEPNPVTVYKADRQLRLQEQDAVKELLLAYFKLEALCSLAKAHEDMQLVFPELGGALMVNDMKHPLTGNCIANNIALNGEYVLLITGPNMAGKSTFLKSLGLAFVMAYAGIGVCASYARLPFYNAIVTSINIEDDIGQGYSYFYSEVQQVKAFAMQLKEKSSTLIIADEMFKGTNVKDAQDCTETVVRGFLNFPQSMFVVATHLVETVGLFKGQESCRLLCFDGEISEGNIAFDYKIREGICATRLGRYIMERESIPNLLGL